MASIEQAAANLAAALESGLAQDAESALASYAEATAGVEDVPEADNGPIKSASDAVIEEDEDENELLVEPSEAEVGDAPSVESGIAAEELEVEGLSVEGVDIDAIADAELGNS